MKHTSFPYRTFAECKGGTGSWGLSQKDKNKIFYGFVVLRRQYLFVERTCINVKHTTKTFAKFLSCIAKKHLDVEEHHKFLRQTGKKKFVTYIRDKSLIFRILKGTVTKGPPIKIKWAKDTNL